eukprot:Nitzschia sp. Nitz4//NODE_590_length_10398_cov_65.316349//6698//7987//NITZ4_additional_000086-RA//1//CDS//3329531989//2447//frame0
MRRPTTTTTTTTANTSFGSRSNVRATSLACGEVVGQSSKLHNLNTPLRVRSLASGQMNDSSIAEITVSMGSSSYSHSSPTTMTSYTQEFPRKKKDYDPDCLDASIDGSFVDPYLDLSRKRPLKPEPQIPRFPVQEDSTEDDFQTAYSNQDYLRDRKSIQSPQELPRQRQQSQQPQQHPANVSTRSQRSSISALTEANTTHTSLPPDRVAKARQERRYWNDMVSRRTMTLGTLHRSTAEALFSLGHVHMQLKDYPNAMAAFQSSSKIFKALNGPTHLSVARSLDAYGLATLRHCKDEPGLLQAKQALDDAFSIRFHNLGVWHVDTVETYNRIASVYLHLGFLEKACTAYEEVYLVRKAIYGPKHPSVAISAHGLANVHMKMDQYEEAARFFRLALGVYRKMDLPTDHPTVARLLQDIQRLELQKVKRRGR